MIYELRTYDLKIGRTAEYLTIFGEKGYPVLSRYAEPVGFWQGGPTGTGIADQVHHIWGYPSVEERIARRTALYADPAWIDDLVPLVFATFRFIQGRLLTLDDVFAGPLRAAQDGGPIGPVVASWTGGEATALPGCFARFRAITGQVGETLHLRPLSAAQIDQTPDGIQQDLWIPASFSRIG